MPETPRSALSRRALLRSGVAASVLVAVPWAASCGVRDDVGVATGAEDDDATPDDQAVLDDALADAERLLGLAQGSATAAPSPEVEALVGRLTTHVEVLGGDVVRRPSRRGPGSGSGQGGGGGGSSAAVRALRDEVEASAGRRRDEAAQVASGELAQVLASIAASHAQSLLVLDGLLAGGGS